jgi:hypothetical protein
MSLKAQLAKAKSLWKKGKEMKPDFDNVVPDGVYVGKLTSAELGESEASGRLQVKWSAVISGGEYKGEKITWWSGLKTEQNFFYLQRDLTRLGVDVPEDINDLEESLKEVEKEKPAIRFRTKTDGEFQNVRILKKLNASEDDSDLSDDTDAVPEDVEDEGETTEAPAKAKAKAKKEEPEEEVVEEEVEEEVAADDDDDTPALEVGVRVAFDFKDEEIVGEVSEVDADKETAKIKGDNGKSYKGVKFEKLRPAPKAKVKKK